MRVTVQPQESGLCVAIADTGHGIPAEYLAHIFDRFVRVPGSPGGGAGLGLAIAKRIVEAHGGHTDRALGAGAGDHLYLYRAVRPAGWWGRAGARTVT